MNVYTCLMKIYMQRYYGDEVVTKSRVTIEGTDFRCEAREPAFRDYSETFPGASKFCLPVGEFLCKPIATELSPMTLTVMKAPAHRSCRFIHDLLCMPHVGNIVLGMVEDEQDEPEHREMKDSQETWERFQVHVYEAFQREEEIMVKISNYQ